MDQELINLNREILELKTAQIRPATFGTYYEYATIGAGVYDGFYFWRITYEDVGDTNAPVTVIYNGSGFCLREYDSVNNRQAVEYYADDQTYGSDDSFRIMSTRPIAKIEQVTAPDPFPVADWEQVREFYPEDMGTAPGWCLQNCRLGYHVYTGTYPTARADMQAQANNGTLHSLNSLPDNVAVPVYIDTGIPEGHIGVYDRGTFYSDGAIINNWISYYGAENIWGWGEFCDGARVVQHT